MFSFLYSAMSKKMETNQTNVKVVLSLLEIFCVLVLIN